MQLQFLGTGGGRFATISQKRMTGGFRIDDIDGKNIHIDPGPGALVRSHQYGLNPRKINLLLVSHCHTDHYNDAEVLIESMTQGMTKKAGHVIGSTSVIYGHEELGPCISQYHQSKPKISCLKPGDEVVDDNIKIRATKTNHSDPTCVGFNIQCGNFNLSYTSDTEYFPELADEHKEADILIGNVIKEGERKIKGHLRTIDFKQLIEEVQPKIAIMTHLGVNLIMNNPFQNTRTITEETGIRTIAATDGLTMNLDQYL
ncbi:MBL fold metallo-hydrolase [Methanosphaera cuniculi]|uniref:MBL fold metallo-hydrolase n=1 Tax=Methanosphaera cuniculi TaxID=1077256 RepID=A0A2A2HFD6_9EURY|nr:MBL fold metallo-hydrolase [Methanosphaera cuniculi]PAV08010.1 MBL fold metallo-hydrolase [Methanosphaera cuniculi]PWL08741.1 ribonuclease BN [Methanosphaera cuniculi]